jgi:hypothetical protein
MLNFNLYTGIQIMILILFLYASFVIYISINMVEIMWVRVNYKVMFIFSNYFDHDQKLEIIIFRR